jgi:hypothetical protein
MCGPTDTVPPEFPEPAGEDVEVLSAPAAARIASLRAARSISAADLVAGRLGATIVADDLVPEGADAVGGGPGAVELPVSGVLPPVSPSVNDMLVAMSDGPSELERRLKAETIAMILWGGANTERSLQKRIGPSELGAECSRQIAYKLAEVPEVNDTADPWPSIIGTSVHAWLADKLPKYRAALDLEIPLTEQEIRADQWVSGNTDVYMDKVVRDWKVLGKDSMDKVRKGLWPQKYIIQGHIYGRGISNMGYPVESVAIIALPRAGRLKDLVVHAEPYDEDVALRALDRRVRISNNLRAVDIASNPQAWPSVPATAGDCYFCPFYDKNLPVASDRGCPGF